jgi:hypothetical protein
MSQIANALGIMPASRIDGTVSPGSIIVVFSVAPEEGSTEAYNAGEGTVAVKLNKMAISPGGAVLRMGPIVEVTRVDRSPLQPIPEDKGGDDDGIPVGTVVGAVIGLATVSMVAGVFVARKRRSQDLETVAAQAYIQNHRPGMMRELGNEMYTLDEASDEGGSRTSRTSQMSQGWGAEIANFLNAKRTSLQRKTSRGSMRVAEHVSDIAAAIATVPAAAVPRPRSSSQVEYDRFAGEPPSRVKRSSRNKSFGSGSGKSFGSSSSGSVWRFEK